jgi:LCP family protein required for cell wall assembly
VVVTSGLVGWSVFWLHERPFEPRVALDLAEPALAAPPEFLPEVHPALPTELDLRAPEAIALVEPPARPPVRAIRPSLDTVNVLLAGIDRHRGYKRGGSTDTIVVAAFDEASGHLGLIGVPRDLYVAFDGRQTRLNAVYGLARLKKQDPLDALERVIEDTLGLPIGHSIAIDLQVFETAVDVVGGIHVNVDCAIDDNFIDGRVEGGRRRLSLDAGLQHLDGVTASMFVRSRHGRSDFSRARRQQAALLGLRRKLLTMDGASKLPALLDGIDGSIETHMSRLELIRLARRMLRVEPAHLHGVVLGHRETIGFRTEKNWSVLLPDDRAIESRLNGLFSSPTPGAPLPGAKCAARDAALR